MSQQSPPSSSSGRPTTDPWHAFGYLVSGVAAYGGLGWLLDRWLGTTFLVAVGILVGAGLGLYLTISRLNAGAAPDDRTARPSRTTQPTDQPEQD
jgi:ATP synthase protein I